MFEVKLKSGHPTGSYMRAGIRFYASAPTALETVPDAVRADPWLVVTEIPDPTPPPPDPPKDDETVVDLPSEAEVSSEEQAHAQEGGRKGWGRRGKSS
jgi:outer membrane biosynthesis protein TonB